MTSPLKARLEQEVDAARRIEIIEQELLSTRTSTA